MCCQSCFKLAESSISLRAMIEILRTNDPTLITFAEALLAGEDIDCFVLDVHMSVLEGTIGMLPKRVMVGEKDAFRARAVLTDNSIEISAQT